MALYNATAGPSWNDNANWLSDAPLDRWHGVTVNADGRVTELHLPENRLRGELPPELGGLSELRNLRLWSNQLSGLVPPELAGLTKLEQFAVGGNRLGGEIPHWLGNLRNLRELHLPTNRFSGQVPSWIGELPLDRLLLGNNRLTGEIPTEMGNLDGLRSLWLGGNSLTGCIPGELRYVPDNDFAAAGLPFCTETQVSGSTPIPTPSPESTPVAVLPDRAALVALYNATAGPSWKDNANWLSDAPLDRWHGVTTAPDGQVTRMDLRNNNLSGSLPPELGRLSGLTWLVLGGNRLSGEVPPELGNLVRLETLSLWDNRLSGEIPVELGDLPNLRELYLWGNQLTGQIPRELSNLTKLEHFSVGSNRLVGEIPSWLGTLAGLKELHLTTNGFSGPLPQELERLTDLREFNVSRNRLTGEVPAWLGDAPLRRLFLNDNRFTGVLPAELVRLSGLEWLLLAGNRLGGCVPGKFRDIPNNDLDRLGLPVCSEATRPEGDQVRYLQDPEVRYLDWEIGPDVPGYHYRSLRDGIVLMHRYASSLGLPDVSGLATFYLYHDTEALVPVYARELGMSPEAARRKLPTVTWTAEAGLGFIFAFSAAISREGVSPDRMMRVAAHELSHVYQYGMGSIRAFSTSHDQVRVHGPAWMSEGGAEFQMLRALAKGGVAEYGRDREGYVRRASEVEAPLSEMETYDGLRATPGRYQLGTLAMELLAAEAGEEAVLGYWTLLSPETTWRETFTTAFGMTIDEFYELFEKHRSAGFPGLDLP